ncbi:hypothetical protein CYMTET_28275 [Cymbomonas tetramitiformis]|uniref:Uncharacterized protein n=1 Tax=Cymbomonas tetramitiformis TaxID=36881 RepID=A0AAE0FNC8_9CHLO|nr:hypothetical protein CYMTET_28275 [Cymbomonas tetramitiformis]
MSNADDDPASRPGVKKSRLRGMDSTSEEAFDPTTARGCGPLSRSVCTTWLSNPQGGRAEMSDAKQSTMCFPDWTNQWRFSGQSSSLKCFTNYASYQNPFCSVRSIPKRWRIWVTISPHPQGLRLAAAEHQEVVHRRRLPPGAALAVLRSMRRPNAFHHPHDLHEDPRGVVPREEQDWALQQLPPRVDLHALLVLFPITYLDSGASSWSNMVRDSPADVVRNSTKFSNAGAVSSSDVSRTIAVVKELPPPPPSTPPPMPSPPSQTLASPPPPSPPTADGLTYSPPTIANESSAYDLEAMRLGG